MRLVACIVLCAGALVAAASSASGEATMITVEAHDRSNAEFWFEVANFTEQNPSMMLARGQAYTFTVHNRGAVEHNLHFGAPISQMTGLIAPGEQATLTFTVPEDAPATGAYWCDPHRGLGMGGDVQFGDVPLPPTATDPPAPTPSAEPRDTPMPSFLAVILAIMGTAGLRSLRAHHGRL